MKVVITLTGRSWASGACIAIKPSGPDRMKIELDVLHNHPT